MSFQVKEPILVIGLGGAGSKLAIQAKDVLNSDCLIISNDQKDIQSGNDSIKVSTDSVINPSVQLIRGAAYKEADQIRSKISKYSTIILMTNLAGKTGSAISPVVSEICKESDKGLISFAIMPFKYEKDRIFNSGISLKRVRANSECTIVLDNDSLLESNPDLSPNTCYSIANNAIMHVVSSLHSSEIPNQTNILTTSKNGQNMEESLRDSLKMLYDNTTPNAVKRSMLYVVGGNNIPVGVINSITNLTNGILGESSSQVDMVSSNESKIVMLSSIQGMTKFEKYDPLGVIPQENTLDWAQPDCSIDYKLDLYQLE
ncbi:MAG: cell division protein FtsZ [Nitrosarchaeum sp.]|nr:cell division protein FtsZ [Nitrosarchaeum sp.]